MVKKVSCKQLTNFPDWLQHRMNAIFLYFMVYILIPFNNFESFTHMPRLGMPDFGITLQFRSFITNYAFSLIEKVKASNTSMVEDTLRGVERVFVLLVKLYRVPALYPLSLFPFLQFFSYRSCRQNRPASQTLNQCSLVTISKTRNSRMAAHCRQGLRRILFLQPSRTATLAKPAFFRYSSTLQDDFEKAKDRLNTLQDDPGNETKLKIYALFKQVRLWTLGIM